MKNQWILKRMLREWFTEHKGEPMDAAFISLFYMRFSRYGKVRVLNGIGELLFAVNNVVVIAKG